MVIRVVVTSDRKILPVARSVEQVAIGSLSYLGRFKFKSKATFENRQANRIATSLSQASTRSIIVDDTTYNSSSPKLRVT